MIRYDGMCFALTDIFYTLFGKIEDKERWIKENSVMVDCIIVALANEGLKKDTEDSFFVLWSEK